jgi:uncharacterized protein
VRLWVDADATPRDVKDIVFRAAHRLGLDTIVVANQRVPVPLGHPMVSAVRVEGGPDAADRHIAENAVRGDVAVTADIPLASQLVAAGVAVVDPRGYEHTTETIGERLSIRDFADALRGAGVETGGPRPFGPKDKQAFASALDRVLTRALRRP